MRRRVIIGNWKMNTGLDEAFALTGAAAAAAEAAGNRVEVGICPPFPWIVPIGDWVIGDRLQIGAQDCSPEAGGAFTGDVSLEMIAPWCRLVLVGHSERRQIHGEDDELVGKKLRAVLAAELTPVLCVGESLDARRAGRASEVVVGQLAAATRDLDNVALARCLVAYEPVWAIGTGVAATADDATEMAGQIRGWLAARGSAPGEHVRILYGGSASAANAAELLAAADVDGLLVGSASLDGDAFARIIQTAARASDATE